MHAWMLQLADVRDAAVAGDLDAVHAGARTWLGALQDDVAPDWDAQVADVRREATTLSEAESLDKAAEAIARLAGSCGRCHETKGVVDAVDEHLPPDTDPPKGDSPQEVMRQHRWAAARMWEGLVGPSEPRWTRGTTMFVILPDCPEDTGATEGPDRCHEARALARRAHVVEASEGRISLYGRLLTTCADCHTAAASDLSAPASDPTTPR